MYNDVDMVWLADPFPYLEGEHDVYFMDDMAFVSLPALLTINLSSLNASTVSSWHANKDLDLKTSSQLVSLNTFSMDS